MMDYRNSIKCKYCAHFQASSNKCYLYHSYDKSLDKDCEKCDGFYQYTEPDSKCEHFTLDAFEVVIKSQLESKRNDGMPPQRSDGSYIVQIPDSLRKELAQDSEEIPTHFNPTLGCLLGVLLFLLIPIIFVPLFINMDSGTFIIVVFVTAIVIKAITYFRNR